MMEQMMKQRCGEEYGTQSNLAKVVGARSCERIATQAIQTMGGMGYACDSHVERLWRDARLFTFAPVSEEMILNYVSQHSLGMPRSY